MFGILVIWWFSWLSADGFVILGVLCLFMIYLLGVDYGVGFY